VGVIVVELPTGTVTLVLTDIEGSTRMLRSLGDDYGAVLRTHRAILREVVHRNGGVAADDVAGGRALTFDQALDHAAAWADQQGIGAEDRQAT
jgi:class 3 adenylate cyclase